MMNKGSLQHGTVLRQTELGIYAISLATSYIQKASALAYDENAIGKGMALANLPPGSVLSSNLGVESGEVQNDDATFDDFDDYNGFSRDTLIPNVDSFHVRAKVYYIRQDPPYDKVEYPTWLKRMEIEVSSTISRSVFTGEDMEKGMDFVKLYYIMSYH